MDLSGGMFLGWLICMVVSAVPVVAFFIGIRTHATYVTHKTSPHELIGWVLYLVIVVLGGVLGVAAITQGIQPTGVTMVMSIGVYVTVFAFVLGGIRLILAINFWDSTAKRHQRAEK